MEGHGDEDLHDGQGRDNPEMSSGSNSRHPRNVNFFPFLCAHSVGK
jgi:hypothetical protein